jgi:hypothetical protein
MKTTFSLLIGEDKIPFFGIDVDENGEAVEESQSKKLYAFRNGARIVDTSDLGYLPHYGSIYSEESRTFALPEGFENHRTNYVLEDGVTVFSYLVDNVYYGSSFIKSGNEKMDMLIAAMSSDPQIVENEGLLPSDTE